MSDRIEMDSGERLPTSGGAAGPRWGRRLLTLLIAIAAIGGFAMVVIYSYGESDDPGEPGKAPVITAEDGPIKVRPESPGGMSVPYQDKQVYGQIDSARMPEKVEKLLPPPEPLVVRPPPPPQVAEAPPPAAAAVERDSQRIASELQSIAPAAGGTVPPPPPPQAAKQDRDRQVAATPPQKAAEKPAVPPPPAAPAAPRQTAKATDRAQAKPAPPLSSAYRIQIASLRSEQAAKRAWGKLTKDNGDLFGKLRHRIVRVDLAGKGTFYRLQAGPLPGESEAKALCSRVKQRKIGCLVVRP